MVYTSQWYISNPPHLPVACIDWLATTRWKCCASIQEDLLKNPSLGDMVRGLGGIRKARCSNPARGKGKRGGFRYLYLYLEDRAHIHLLYLLDKNEQADLSNEERNALRSLVEEIKRTKRGNS